MAVQNFYIYLFLQHTWKWTKPAIEMFLFKKEKDE